MHTGADRFAFGPQVGPGLHLVVEARAEPIVRFADLVTEGAKGVQHPVNSNARNLTRMTSTSSCIHPVYPLGDATQVSSKSARWTTIPAKPTVAAAPRLISFCAAALNPTCVRRGPHGVKKVRQSETQVFLGLKAERLMRGLPERRHTPPK